MAIKKGIDMGDYLYSAKEFDAYKWCVNNGVYISPLTLSTTKWFVCIEMNKKINISPESYGKIEIWKQIFKYYTYYYEKYKK